MAELDIVLRKDDAEELLKIIKQSGAKVFLTQLEQSLEKWKEVSINIAVIGSSGSGKSSFINAVRELTAEDDGAAEVGEVQILVGLKSYAHPLNPCLKFWDLPGLGTAEYPRETYMRDVKADRYDIFMLVSAGRFTEEDIWLGREITKLGKKYIYVRTKIDSDVSNNRKAHPRLHDKHKVLSTIRDEIKKSLKDDSTPLFLIDSYRPQCYDFSDLEKKLIENFAKMKRTALVLSLGASSKQIVQSKVSELRSRLWQEALLATSATACPVPLEAVAFEFDLNIVLSKCKFYKSQLGLDETSLMKFSWMTSFDIQKLNEIVAQSGVSDTVDGIKSLAETVELSEAAALVEKVSTWFPVLGTIVISHSSYGGTYLLLKTILDKLEDAALKILSLTAEHLAQMGDEDLE